MHWSRRASTAHGHRGAPPPQSHLLCATPPFTPLALDGHRPPPRFFCFCSLGLGCGEREPATRTAAAHRSILPLVPPSSPSPLSSHPAPDGFSADITKSNESREEKKEAATTPGPLVPLNAGHWQQGAREEQARRSKQVSCLRRKMRRSSAHNNDAGRLHSLRVARAPPTCAWRRSAASERVRSTKARCCCCCCCCCWCTAANCCRSCPSR
jgi:hypothetical protein